jgi:LPXTG-motif cell wall-anchored protein
MSPGRFRYLIMHVLGSRARRSALLGAATVMVGGAMFTAPAHAAPVDENSQSTGKATATAARADLDVSVANAAKVPVRASLNAVQAPQDAEKKLLTAEVNGANKGQPIRLVQADVARSRAKAGTERSVGNVKLVGLKAFAPGLPGTPLVSADLLTASAACAAGEKPVANADLENVTVLGKPVKINGVGSQQIKLPALGSVDVNVEQETTKTASGAATALKLSYELNPAKLNVVKAAGEIVLSEATCETPKGDGGNGGGGNEPGPQTGGGDGGSDDGLAETGGNSATPIIAGVGALLVAGGGAMYLIRRRSARSNG